MTTQDLIARINDFIAPVSPFDDIEHYSDASAKDKIRAQWFATVEIEEVCRSLAEIITTQAPSLWQYREDSYRLEICETAGLLRNTDHAVSLMHKIVPLLNDENKQSLVIACLGFIGLEQSVTYLEKLPIHKLSTEQLVDLACSLGMIGGKDSVVFLNKLKDHAQASDPEVKQEIAIALSNMVSDG